MKKKAAFLPVFSAALGLAACLVAGCSTINLDTTGDTQAVYEFGRFEMLLNANAPTIYAATQKALQSLDLYQTQAQLNTFDAQLHARARNDQKISIEIQEINSRQTMVRIRWGTTGNKASSLALYKAIESNLH